MQSKAAIRVLDQKEGRASRLSFSLSKRTAPYFFLAPFLILFSIFWLGPIVYSFYLSLLNTRSRPWFWDPTFNWNRLLDDVFFKEALQNTFTILVIQVPIMLTLAVALALIFNSPYLKLKGIYRFAFFAPLVLGAVPYSTVFRLIFSPKYGILNALLEKLGLPEVKWLFDPVPAMATIIIAITWRWTGYNAIIILAGLQGIPESYNEAARIDGANPRQVFWHITLPLLRPVLLFTVVLSTIGTLQLFTEPWLITRTAPAGATEFLGTYLYKQGFRSLNFGYASAIAYVIAGIAGILALVQLRLAGRDEN
jgi:lactose/L-arabinose transport system permease protein